MSPDLPEDGPVLVDASFVLAVLDGDEMAGRFADVMTRAVITAVNLGEVLYKDESVAGLPPAEVAPGLRATGLVTLPVTEAVAVRFTDLRALDAKVRRRRKGRARSLSLADLCCLGHAWEHGLPVLTGDKHWLAVVEAGLPVPVVDFRDPDAG